MAYGTINADLMTTSDGVSSSGLYGFKNRIINGAMVIDQRNAGASVTPANGDYFVDRWNYGSTQASKFTAQQTTTAPSGFTNSIKMTVASAVTIGAGDIFGIDQRIEGFNAADLGWGAAGAATVTLSFWVQSSLTGTFGGSIINGTFNRSYPFTYTINSANTWEQKTVTIAGDTSGTWNKTNGLGIRVLFSLGSGSTYSGTAGTWAGAGYTSATGAVSVVGTASATFYITGVQLEKGSTATSFDYRPYGTELALCQRYYEKSYNVDVVPATALAYGWSSLTLQNYAEGPSGIIFKVTKRANPTMVIYNAVTGASGAMYRISDAASISTTLDYIGTNQVGLVRPASSSANSYYLHWTASIEL